MTLDWRLAAAVRKSGSAPLAAYALTELERLRLVDISRQPGMDLNCTLARGNRLAPIVEVFPLTCELLKSSLRGLLEEYWDLHRPSNYQLAGEDEAFAQFVEAKIACGAIIERYAAEVLRYERACVALAKSLRFTSVDDLVAPDEHRVRHVRFEHDPRILVRALERREIPPPDIAAGDYPVRITLFADVIEVELEGEASQWSRG